MFLYTELLLRLMKKRVDWQSWTNKVIYTSAFVILVFAFAIALQGPTEEQSLGAPEIVSVSRGTIVIEPILLCERESGKAKNREEQFKIYLSDFCQCAQERGLSCNQYLSADGKIILKSLEEIKESFKEQPIISAYKATLKDYQIIPYSSTVSDSFKVINDVATLNCYNKESNEGYYDCNGFWTIEYNGQASRILVSLENMRMRSLLGPNAFLKVIDVSSLIILEAESIFMEPSKKSEHPINIDIGIFTGTYGDHDLSGIIALEKISGIDIVEKPSLISRIFNKLF